MLRARSRLKAFVEREAPEVLVAHGAWAHAPSSLLVLGRASVVYSQHDAAEAKDWPERLARLSPDAGDRQQRVYGKHHPPSLSASKTRNLSLPGSAQIPALGDQDRARLRSELQVEPTQALIIQTSRIEPWKGQGCASARAAGKLKDDPGRVSVIALWTTASQRGALLRRAQGDSSRARHRRPRALHRPAGRRAAPVTSGGHSFFNRIQGPEPFVDRLHRGHAREGFPSSRFAWGPWANAVAAESAS